MRGPGRLSRLGARSDPDVPKGEGVPQPTTEITVIGGDRYRVEGGARDVEQLILGAARGSLMELAWLVEAETGEPVGINPECVVMLRGIDSQA